jgi:hypothetical protein
VFPETAGLSLEEIDYLFVKRNESEVVEAMSSSPALSHSIEKGTMINGGKKSVDEVPNSEHME